MIQFRKIKRQLTWEQEDKEAEFTQDMDTNCCVNCLLHKGAKVFDMRLVTKNNQSVQDGKDEVNFVDRQNRIIVNTSDTVVDWPNIEDYQ